jgi:hypothetical protein
MAGECQRFALDGMARSSELTAIRHGQILRMSTALG